MKKQNQEAKLKEQKLKEQIVEKLTYGFTKEEIAEKIENFEYIMSGSKNINGRYIIAKNIKILPEDELILADIIIGDSDRGDGENHEEVYKDQNYGFNLFKITNGNSK